MRQLRHVLVGDLSLVGRIGAGSTRYECGNPGRRARAGLTGMARVTNGYTSVHERVRYDNYYVETWSPWLDLKIIGRALARFIAAR
jgi:lipopolysaccharide/colanic/teichoic acid biosynthesis glycosyltransferase